MGKTSKQSQKVILSDVPNGLMAKRCRVCGDNESAICYNYDGLSCGSCKSFFFRNAFREQELVCNNEAEKCEITMATRAKCCKCRLQQCFKIGMKRELICKSKSKPKSEIDHIKHQIWNSLNTTSRLLKPLSNNNKTELQFPTLTNHERAKIEEVSGYYKSFVEEITIKTVIEPPRGYEYLKICEEFGSEAVRSVNKNILAFKNYSMNDKMVMIRNFLMVFCSMRNSMYWDTEKQCGRMLEVKEKQYCYRLSREVWRDILPDEFYSKLLQYVGRNKAFMLNDPVIRDFAVTLALFRHDDKVTCPEVQRLHYLEYYYLLRRYLQVKLRTREKFDKHMNLVNNVLDNYPNMLQFSRKFYEFISPRFYVQLMEEVYKV